MNTPPEPRPPPPGKHPVATLERTGAALKILDEEIAEKGRQMGALGSAFSKAKAELRELISRRAFLSKEEDVALEAIKREEQEQRVTSASRSSQPATHPTKKRPLPTGLIPQEKTKKLAAKPPPIWPKSAQQKRVGHDGDH